MKAINDQPFMVGASRYLSQRQLAGLRKAGNIITPGHGEFPSFTESGCIGYVDHIMGATHAEDIAGFKALMWVFSFLPSVLIELILKVSDLDSKFPDAIAGLLRLLNIGIKGVVCSLYYSNLGSQYVCASSQNKVYDVIDYHIECKPE